MDKVEVAISDLEAILNALLIAGDLVYSLDRQSHYQRLAKEHTPSPLARRLTELAHTVDDYLTGEDDASIGDEPVP
jgi:hypothetical protein